MHIHILGICGTFMGSLALLAKNAGHHVSGCDENVYPPMSTQLQAQGIEIINGFDPLQLESNPDLIVVGNAMSRGNPCVEYMLNHRLPYTSGPAWLGEHILRDKHVLAVSGTHGKTTTSSMLAKILDFSGLQPGFLIGGVAQDFGVSARLSESKYFVVEADEYDSAFFDKRSKFVHYHSDTVIINNLEFDHADIFDDLAAIQRQFHHLIRTVPSVGNVIYSSEDENVLSVLDQGCWSRKQAFGLDENDPWQYQLMENDGSVFRIINRANGEETSATVAWQHCGLHNIKNALAAAVAAASVGVSVEQSCRALCKFEGVKRRMEVIYDHNGITVYDDFAHHPTAIKTTLEGLRSRVGEEPILAIIEPRSATMRMGVHRDNLTTAVAAADRVLWYHNELIEWAMDELQATSSTSKVVNSIELLIDQAVDFSSGNGHILIMSNGGFGGLHQKLIKALAAG